MLIFNTAAATNAAINPVLDIETAEKLVNEIYFKTLAQGIDYFNDSQIQTLQLISAQCPDDLGNIVYQARAMYAYVANVDMLSKAGCANSNNLETQPTNIENVENDVNKDIIVFPNPAQNIITLQQSTIFIAGTTVQIYNSLGQIVQSQVITNANKAIELNVYSLVNGSYFVRISNGETVTSKLFIISK